MRTPRLTSSPARWATALGCALILAAGVAGCGTGKDAVSQTAGGDRGYVPREAQIQRWQAGERPAAPDLSGETLTGQRFDYRTVRGHVVVVNFWGQWCAPCRAEAKDLQQVYVATKANRVSFLGVNIRDTQDRALAFERANGITYPSLYDATGRVAVKFRATPPTTVPATIVIDRKGKVAAVFRMAVLASDLRPTIDALAKERA